MFAFLTVQQANSHANFAILPTCHVKLLGFLAEGEITRVHVDCNCVLGLQLRDQIKISIREITYEKTYDRYCKSAKNCLVLKLTIAIEIAIEENLPYQGLMQRRLHTACVDITRKSSFFDISY